MKIIVLGGHGFVGKSLTKRLLDYPYEVFPLSRVDGFDLTDLDSTKKYFSDIKPDVIVNCAAHVGSVHYGLKYPASIVHDNLMMILNLFKAAQEECTNAMMVNLISNCVFPMHSDTKSMPNRQTTSRVSFCAVIRRSTLKTQLWGSSQRNFGKPVSVTH